MNTDVTSREICSTDPFNKSRAAEQQHELLYEYPDPDRRKQLEGATRYYVKDRWRTTGTGQSRAIYRGIGSAPQHSDSGTGRHQAEK